MRASNAWSGADCAAFADSEAQGYGLLGTGNLTRLNLSGEYPVRDFQGNVIGAGSIDENMVTLTIDKVVEKTTAAPATGLAKTLAPVLEQLKGVAILVNKWDLVDEERRRYLNFTLGTAQVPVAVFTRSGAPPLALEQARYRVVVKRPRQAPLLAGLTDVLQIDHLDSGGYRLTRLLTLPSGLQYEVLRPGAGAKPTRHDNVTTHYHGTLIDGTVFDSSYERGEPATFPVGGVIAGWTEALQLMKPGDKWMLYIPFHLGYGSQSTGKIPAYSDLIFQVELLQVVGQ